MPSKIVKAKPQKRKPTQKQTIEIPQKKTKPQKDDYCFIIPEVDQEKYREDVKAYREKKHKSVVDLNENLEDNFARLKKQLVQPVNQTIQLQDEQIVTPSFNQTINQPKKSQINSMQKICQDQKNQKLQVQLTSKPLQFPNKEMKMELEEDIDQNFNFDILKINLNSKVNNQDNRSIDQSKTTDKTSNAKKLKEITEVQEIDAKLKQIDKSQIKLHQSIDQCLKFFQESAIPDNISCRDKEKSLINDFIDQGIKKGQQQALYISGVPGIGKTATVMEVIKHKQDKSKTNQQFQFIYANAMNFGLPDNIYSFLLEKITGINSNKVSKSNACLLLSEYFSKGKLPGYQSIEKKLPNINKIILLDECDNLFTPDQQVLYNLVDWPQQKHANLTIIMIANTMDFPERLKPKLQSRLGNHRLVFKPYDSSQIEEILKQRLKQGKIQDLFANNTINYLGKKIATISTDIRKTLAVCRTSIEIFREELGQNTKLTQKQQIQVDHVQKAYDKIYNRAYHICLQQLNPELKKLILILAVEIHTKGYNFAQLQYIQNRYNQFSTKDEPFTQFELKQGLIKLNELNLVELKEQNICLNKMTWQKQIQETLDKDNFKNFCDLIITLKISVDDIKNGLSGDSIFKQFSMFL